MCTSHAGEHFIILATITTTAANYTQQPQIVGVNLCREYREYVAACGGAALVVVYRGVVRG